MLRGEGGRFADGLVGWLVEGARRAALLPEKVCRAWAVGERRCERGANKPTRCEQKARTAPSALRLRGGKKRLERWDGSGIARWGVSSGAPSGWVLRTPWRTGVRPVSSLPTESISRAAADGENASQCGGIAQISKGQGACSVEQRWD